MSGLPALNRAAHPADNAQVTLRTDPALDRVIRPAAVIPGRAARDIIEWLGTQDVTRGGRWSAGIGSIQRYSGPFDGPSGMRGSAVLLGSLHITWDTYDVTIYRVNVTDAGAGAGLTVDALCDEVLAVVGLTLASCPRADLLAAPTPDPFKRLPSPRAEH